MRLKIEDLKNPVVEVALDGIIPSNGAIINVLFEPNPRLMISAKESGTIIFVPQENGGIKFTDTNKKDIKLLVLLELKAWRIITALIAVEWYLNEKISYRPQIVSYFLKALSPC